MIKPNTMAIRTCEIIKQKKSVHGSTHSTPRHLSTTCDQVLKEEFFIATFSYSFCRRGGAYWA